MKKTMSLFLAFAMMLSLVMFPAVAADETEEHWGASAVQRWVDAGVLEVEGTTEAYEAPVTRAEFAVMLVKMMGYSAPEDAPGFPDVDPDAPYAAALKALAAEGIMLGNEHGEAMPDSVISRAEALVLFARAFKIAPEEETAEPFSDEIDVWALPYANALKSRGVIQGIGDNLFNGSEKINMASMATIFDNTIGAYITEDGATVTGEVNGFVVIAANNVTIKDAAIAGSVIVAPEAGEKTKLTVTNSTAEALIVETEKAAVAVNSSTLTEVDLTADGATLNVGKGTEIADVKVVGSDAKVDVVKGATVKTVTTEGDKTVVSGTGTVESVKVDAGTGTKISTKGTEVAVAPEAGKVSANGKTVEPGTEATTSSTGGSSSGGGSVSTIVNYPMQLANNNGLTVTATKPSSGSNTVNVTLRSTAPIATGMYGLEGDTWFVNDEDEDLNDTDGNGYIAVSLTDILVEGKDNVVAQTNEALSLYKVPGDFGITTEDDKLVKTTTIPLENAPSDLDSNYRFLISGSANPATLTVVVTVDGNDMIFNIDYSGVKFADKENLAAVNAVVAALEEIAPAPRETANKTAALAYVTPEIGALLANTDVSIASTGAVAVTEFTSSAAGATGTFTFTVTLEKGNSSVDATVTVTIAALPAVPETAKQTVLSTYFGVTGDGLGGIRAYTDATADALNCNVWEGLSSIVEAEDDYVTPYCLYTTGDIQAFDMYITGESQTLYLKPVELKAGYTIAYFYAVDNDAPILTALETVADGLEATFMEAYDFASSDKIEPDATTGIATIDLGDYFEGESKIHDDNSPNGGKNCQYMYAVVYDANGDVAAYVPIRVMRTIPVLLVTADGTESVQRSYNGAAFSTARNAIMTVVNYKDEIKVQVKATAGYKITGITVSGDSVLVDDIATDSGAGTYTVIAGTDGNAVEADAAGYYIIVTTEPVSSGTGD